MVGPGLFRSHILEHYVAREFVKLMALSLLTFVSLFVVVDFFEKIDRLVRAHLGAAKLLEYLILKLPFAVSQVLPAAVLLGVMLTFGLMSRSHETMAIRTSGLNILCLMRPIIIYAGLVALLLLSLNLYLVPWSQGQLSVFWQTEVEKKPPRNLHNLEHFWYKGDQAIYNIVMFRKDIQTLEGVKIYLFDRQFHLVQIVAAARAQWQGDHWHFFDGYVQTFDANGVVVGEKFHERNLMLTEQPKDFADLEKKVTEMDVNELYRYMERLERDGYKSTPYRVDLYDRFSLAATPLILVILGLGLALRHEQIHITSMVAAGLGLMFGYWLFFGFCASFGQAGSFPPLLAVIAPHLVFGGLAVVLLRQVTK
ncbi:MAG: LPS export ABC transporter permease LptG [Syntrophobacterales bacterium]|jgi:lipopolysaccharide export system permease protein|nr:LPS export ABC transporter permease LptG [Syntrophobacterales bacterium]